MLDGEDQSERKENTATRRRKSPVFVVSHAGRSQTVAYAPSFSR